MQEFTITVLAKPSSKVRTITYDEIKKIFVIRTPKAPEDGKANKDVVDMLAEHFSVPKSAILILRGHSGKRKIIKIMAP